MKHAITFIANAVTDAVGAQVRDLPITPEKVLRAMRGGIRATSVSE